MDLSSLFGGAYFARRVLVTGHTGFKGSWLAYWLRRMGAEVTGLALDPDTQPSHWQVLSPQGVDDRRVDLRDAAAVRGVLAGCMPEVVFHLAAQPLVRRSYVAPAETFDVNVMGLVNLLEAIREVGGVIAVVNATTDKVYEENCPPDGYAETDPLGGHDPYSSSKACAEIVSTCYRESFFRVGDGGPRLATARAGNVIGGGDWAEDRLVPDAVRAATLGQVLRIRHPSATRPWQHVLEPLSGYLLLGQRLLAGDGCSEAWNFGPGPAGELSVMRLGELVMARWPAVEIRLDAGPRPHEAGVLRLDARKARTRLGWRPLWPVEEAVARTVDWYRAFLESGEPRTGEDLDAYVARARRDAEEWAS
jgi:CDP-glucose 4,6-dehydratase